MNENSMVVFRPRGTGLSTEIEQLMDRAKDLAGSSKAQATKRAYASDWRKFEDWCDRHEVAALPAVPEAVALYVAALVEEGRKPSTVSRALVSIAVRHKFAGIDLSPTTSAMVRETMKGLRRRLGVAQRQVSPLVVEHLRRIVEHLPGTKAGLRDRALLLVGFAGAFRRSELVSLDVADLGEQPDGLVITLRRSKTDHEGEGRKLGIPFATEPSLCPVRALRAWREAAVIDEGALFRPVDKHDVPLPRRLSPKSVAAVVKRCVAAAGYDPRVFAGHSLRAGFATAAAAAGKSERSIMKQTGHRSEAMLRRYIRDGQVFLGNALEGLL